MRKFPFYHQLDQMDCGATCLKMIAKHYGKTLSIEKLRDRCFTDREGVSVLGISDAAESVGFHTLAVRIPYEILVKETPLPCILYWRERHFLILYKATKNKLYVADPASGLLTYTPEEFQKAWIIARNGEAEEGFVLLLEPTPAFYDEEGENTGQRRKIGLAHYIKYLRPHKKYYLNLILSLAIASITSLIFPFLTQSMVDVGVNNQDVNFVWVILIAQVVLFLSNKSGEFIRSWISFHMISKVGVTILSDFIVKLMKLPVSFFERKTPGDILKRMEDHYRIQLFLTTTLIYFSFTLMTIIIFGTVLATYNMGIFAIYVIGSLLYFGWFFILLEKRKELDYRNFDQAVIEENKTLELITGMQEIKLQNCERQKRWEWENVQAKLFKLGIEGVSLGQIEQTGSSILFELKNILMTFYAANLVIEGEISLGMMMAIQYIVGQLNGTTNDVIKFVHDTQNAKLSIERLTEIHNQKDEQKEDSLGEDDLDLKQDIILENVFFQYGGPRSKMVLEDISLIIPNNKVTAIVGTSGSGKSTLLSLLLKSYKVTKGEIRFGQTDINSISFRTWRQKFACVMQQSFIFSDTIARNIAIGEEFIDKQRMKEATVTANIREFIEELPIEYNTKIGLNGIGLSQGQKQRILLARAIYKNREILLLDEATNALDANNEKVIINNLNEYFKGKTVVVVAHRLSTVKNADQIVVLEKGKILEIGTHESLLKTKGAYFNLIKNQLEIGN